MKDSNDFGHTHEDESNEDAGCLIEEPALCPLVALKIGLCRSQIIESDSPRCWVDCTQLGGRCTVHGGLPKPATCKGGACCTRPASMAHASERPIDLVSDSDTEDLSASESDDEDDLLSAPSLRDRLMARAAAGEGHGSAGAAAATGSGEGDVLSGEQGWCATDAHPAWQARWLWHSGGKGSAAVWSVYSAAEGRQVERAYRQFACAPDNSALRSCDIAIGTRAYVIDFERLTQAPTRQPERTRKIRREQRRAPRALVSLDVLHAVPRAIPAAAAEFGAVSASLRSRLVRVAAPQAGAMELQDEYALGGCVAVVQCARTASYVDTARRLQTAGAVAVLFVSAHDEVGSLCARVGEDHGDISIPCVCVSRSSGDQLTQDPAEVATSESMLPETNVMLRLRPPRSAS
eukprot:COSAG02_NODE_14953_length_1220_cov_1.611954_1_plen_404_part_01